MENKPKATADELMAALSVPLPEPLHEENTSVPLSPGEIALKIIQDCSLQNALSLSVCLSCANRVLCQDNSSHATLYCKELFRDLESCITRCTSFTQE